MRRDIAERWAAALKSGEYSQTTSNLHDDSGYCCLGVLCDLYDKEHEQNNWELEPLAPEGMKYYNHLEGTNGVLPKKVMEWAGMNNQSGGADFQADDILKPTSKILPTLIDLNDTYRKSFSEIADHILELKDQL